MLSGVGRVSLKKSNSVNKHAEKSQVVDEPQTLIVFSLWTQIWGASLWRVWRDSGASPQLA